MSLLKIFQSKGATAPKPQTAATPASAPMPTNASAAPSAETTAAVKAILSAFASEAQTDSAKIHAIGQELMGVQTLLLNAADSRRAPEANARARDQIKAILGDLRALHGEFADTAQTLRKASQ